MSTSKDDAMHAPTTSTSARTRHQTAHDAVLAALNAKLAKAKLAPVATEDVAWSYVWATMLGGSAHGTIGLSLQGRVGRRDASAFVGRFAPGAEVPPEVEAVRTPSPAITLDTPHVAVIQIANPRLHSTETHLVVAAYTRKGRTRLVTHRLGETHTIPMLHTLTPDGVWWAGGLRGSAAAALMAAPEGGTWRWRNAPYHRLDADAIRALIPHQPVPFLGVETN